MPAAGYISVPVVGLVLALIGVREEWVYIVVGAAVLGIIWLMHNKSERK